MPLSRGPGHLFGTAVPPPPSSFVVPDEVETRVAT